MARIQTSHVGILRFCLNLNIFRKCFALIWPSWLCSFKTTSGEFLEEKAYSRDLLTESSIESVFFLIVHTCPRKLTEKPLAHSCDTDIMLIEHAGEYMTSCNVIK